MMRWIDQISSTGCVPACIASITGIPIGEIPDFMAPRDGSGWSRVRAWLRTRGWAAVDLQAKSLGRGRGYVLLRGVSPRGSRHCVVGLDGRIVHDPHPSKVGMVSIDTVTELVPIG